MTPAAQVRPLRAVGERVRVETVRPDDVAPYRRAVQGSFARLSRWNPANPEDLAFHLSQQSLTHRTFMIRAVAPPAGADHDLVGKVNVTNVVRGRLLGATIGYDAYDPYAGQGLFREGLALVLDLAFTREPEGMGLHRIEANVQPGNVTSAGLLRRLGFTREGFSPAYLHLDDGTGRPVWRDHDRYGLTREAWVGGGAAAGPVFLAHVVDPGPGADPAHRAAVVAAARALATELRCSVVHGDLDPADHPAGAVVVTTPPPTGGGLPVLTVDDDDVRGCAEEAGVIRLALTLRAQAHALGR